MPHLYPPCGLPAKRPCSLLALILPDSRARPPAFFPTPSHFSSWHNPGFASTMPDARNGKQPEAAGAGDLNQASLRTLPTAAFIGYRPFPPVMNLYPDYSFLVSALKFHKLCGATEDDFIYLVELHVGYTPRGPLNFGRGYYLRNGTSFKDPILTATGEEFLIPLLVSLFKRDTIVKLPPLDEEKNPRDMVDEVLRSGSSKEHGITFGFTVEVGVKKLRRESFEWRKARAPLGGKHEQGSHTIQTQYTLHRLSSGGPAPPSSTPSTSEQPDDDSEAVALLSFNHVLSFTHYFTLELKGEGLTGELGDRWAMMVVTTALSLNFLRQFGKTGKATVGAAQAIHSKKT